jgi:TRAP-type C4-dicarboxylate transport system substrate-binding protein
MLRVGVSILVLAAGAAAMPAARSYVLRCAIVSGARTIWTSDDVKIDATVETQDAGAIALKPAKGGIQDSSTW